jgi:hypothetical protein
VKWPASIAAVEESLDEGGGTMNAMERQTERSTPWAIQQPLERSINAETASKLTNLALRQWERALTGILAVPTAAALTAAASAMYAAALVERAFETVESAVSEIGRTMTPRDGAGQATEHRMPEAKA